jgi:hypothetical protein
MRPIGFSTGAIAKTDFHRALRELRTRNISVVELSALRLEELEPLILALPTLDLESFSFVSIHAPSRFPKALESQVVEHLFSAIAMNIPVVVHPDTVYSAELWKEFGRLLLIENMDKRKSVGRTVTEMRLAFDRLPDASFCFDIGHARQVDPTMTEGAALLRAFGDRLAEVHLSEVNTASRHDPVSLNAVRAFQSIAAEIPEKIPVILEALIDSGQSTIEAEIERARCSLRVMTLATV